MSIDDRQHNLNVRHVPPELMHKLHVRAAQEGIYVRVLVIRLLEAATARGVKEKPNA